MTAERTGDLIRIGLAATLLVLTVLAIQRDRLSLFERDATVGGVPLLFVYVFVAWIAVIVLVALIVERGSPDERRSPDEPRADEPRKPD